MLFALAIAIAIAACGLWLVACGFVTYLLAFGWEGRIFSLAMHMVWYFFFSESLDFMSEEGAGGGWMV